MGSNSNSSSSSGSLAAGAPPGFGHRQLQQQQQVLVSNVRHSSTTTTSAASKGRLNPLAPAFWPQSGGQQQCAQALLNTKTKTNTSNSIPSAMYNRCSASSRRSSSNSSGVSHRQSSSSSQGSGKVGTGAQCCHTRYIQGEDGWGWDVNVVVTARPRHFVGGSNSSSNRRSGREGVGVNSSGASRRGTACYVHGDDGWMLSSVEVSAAGV